ncbi:MAG: efflux RND transporter permease subunit [Geminicoccaceae bacterium]
MQVRGIGNVDIGGSSLPAVRVELNPAALFQYGIGLEDVRAALSAANANSAKGTIEEGDRRYQLYANDQVLRAAGYDDLVIAWRNGRPVFLRDVRRRWTIRSRACAIWARSTASVPYSCSCSSSRAATSSTSSTG